MADEPNNGTQVVDDKVEFTPKQQEKVNELIQKAMGKAAKDLRDENAQFKTQLQSLQDELKEAKTAAAKAKTPGAKADANEDIAALQAQIDAMKEASKLNEQEAARWRKEAETKVKELETSKKANLDLQKNHAITTAANGANFINPDVVRKLTEDQVVWSDDYKRFVVLNDAGQVRLDATLENPLSLGQFYEEFATKNKYLVRGDVVPGTGSTPGSQPGVKSKFEVTDIFGPKSSAKAANELAKSNPQEYKRLKVIARAQGLIA